MILPALTTIPFGLILIVPDDKINAEFHVALAYKFTFTQGCSYFLNSFATDWEIYKYCISFSSTVESEEELEKLLLHCIEYF